MKKYSAISIIVITILLLFTFIGCGEQKSIDDQFLDDMSAGLEERWRLNDTNKDAEETQEMWESYINAEYDKIIKYKDENFEDTELGERAKKYIDLIEKSKDLLQYFNSTKFDTEMSPIYDSRAVIIYELNKDEKLHVSEEYQDSLMGLVNRGEVVTAVSEIMDVTNFKKTKDEYGWKTYSATVENTANLKFNYFNFKVNLNDSKGVTVETQNPFTENWDIGTKHRFEFSTDKKFESIEIVSCEWN